MGIIELVSNALGAVKEVFGFQSKRLDLKNAQDMKTAQERQNEVDANSMDEKEIAERDVDDIRKELGE